ncbi:MAG: BLUF domain-containing protein [Gillisia sp.]
MRHAICYVSNANENLDNAQVKTLLEFCKEKNMALGIKGVLLYAEGNFFQILEGEKDILMEIFKKIENDPRHHGLITIISRDIPKHTFDEYKVDILSDEYKYAYVVPNEYSEALNGISNEVRKTMEKLLARFISTH